MAGKITALAAAAVVVLTAFSAAADDLAASKALFEKKCSPCHGIEKALSMKKDRAGWAETIRLMQSKIPGLLTDGEAKTIVDYLTEIRGNK